MSEILEHIARVALTPTAYLDLMTEQAHADPDALPDDEREMLEYTRLNLHRTGRIMRTWNPSSDLMALLNRFETPQTWLVLTEPWCGDSAQCLPCLVKMAEQQPHITVQLVLRDANPDLMDQYLTNGSRSIPRLVAFDAVGQELFRWGPRPAAAQEVFLAAKGEGLEKPDILEKLHLFYGRNRGVALDAEFVTLLANIQDGAGVILHRDTDWLVVDKPTGVATHAGQPGELGAVEWLALHLGLETHVMSRLDRGTSGALLLALNPAAAARAQDIHEAGTATKMYEFLSAMDNRVLGLEDSWQRDEALDDKAACTKFARLGTSADGRLFHYRAEITRGRRHQIRRHAQASGVPLLGDDEYGGASCARLCLHCAEIHWPELGEPLTAPRPESFVALLGENKSDVQVAVCHDRRGSWLAAITDAFRAVHRDEIPGLPAAIDVYGPWFDAVWFDETASDERLTRQLHPVLDQIRTRYGCRGGVVRTHRRNPHQRNLVTEVAVVGETPPDVFSVSEHGLQFEINLLKTQHTGLFLDQRDTRRRVALRAEKARMANLFAYTCSFSVVAARNGAEVVFSVDTAKPCLNTGKTNFALNGLNETGQGKFIQEDARKWLARQTRKRDQDQDAWPGYDLVVCDPPVFASARDGGQFSVEKEWPGLADRCAGLLAAGGVAIFANNHRTGDHRFYRRVLTDIFDSVTDLRPPLDFPVFTGRPHHVRTFWCE